MAMLSSGEHGVCERLRAHAFDSESVREVEQKGEFRSLPPGTGLANAAFERLDPSDATSVEGPGAAFLRANPGI